MQKKLYKIRKNKMLGGVAAGLSEYFDVDVVFIRLFFVLSTFFGGVGLIAYIVLWIITPEKECYVSADDPGVTEPVIDEEGLKTEKEAERGTNKKDRGDLAGIVLISIGVFFLADNFLSFIQFHHIFPIIMIAIGAAILLNNKRN